MSSKKDYESFDTLTGEFVEVFRSVAEDRKMPVGEKVRVMRDAVESIVMIQRFLIDRDIHEMNVRLAMVREKIAEKKRDSGNGGSDIVVPNIVGLGGEDGQK